MSNKDPKDMACAILNEACEKDGVAIDDMLVVVARVG